MHYVAMRMPRIAVIALGLCIAVGSASSAFADATPTPTPSPDFQTLMMQYNVALSAYQTEMKSREDLRMTINLAFMGAVNDANRKAKSALRTAKTPAAKSEVIATQKAAIALANSNRYASILAMGAPPEKPIQPVKPSKAPQISSKKKSKSAKASPTPTS